MNYVTFEKPISHVQISPFLILYPTHTAVSQSHTMMHSLDSDNLL